MTDEQLKYIAKLIIIHDEQIQILSESYGVLMEGFADAGCADECANSLRSSAEQLSALVRDGEVARRHARKFLGIDETGSQKLSD
jgi:hypothetical protein